MYFLYVKGRGYYAGTGCKHISNFNGMNTYPSYEDQKNGAIRKLYTKEIYNIKFKRDSADVKDIATFRTMKEAKADLKRIKGVVDRGMKAEAYTKIDNGIYGTTKISIFTDATALVKAYDKIEIVKIDDYVINKTTKHISAVRAFKILTLSMNSRVCDMCRVSFTKDEPLLSLDGSWYCKHCVENMYSQLKTEFDKNPLAKDISSSWETEMVIRCI